MLEAVSPSSDILADTSPFFAIISSLTRFISTSSLSISTLTVWLTALLLAAAAFFACVSIEGFFVSSFFASFEDVASDTSVCSVFASSLLSVSSLSGKGVVIALASADFISDTFLIIPDISSMLSFDTTTIVNFLSNFSSSISCVEGSDLMTSQCPSRFLNTRNALAAFNIQFSSTVTSISYTPSPFFNASLTAFISKSANASSEVPSPAVTAEAAVCGCVSLLSSLLPPMNELSALIIGSLSSVPSSCVFWMFDT